MTDVRICFRLLSWFLFLFLFFFFGFLGNIELEFFNFEMTLKKSKTIASLNLHE